MERRVTHTGKDKDGDITKLCNPGQAWSRSKRDAIADIKKDPRSYYVMWGEQKAYVKVVKGVNGEYLRADKDRTTRNNLADLDDC